MLRVSPRIRLGLIAAASLAWGGCDGGGGGVDCADLQLSEGTFSATLSEGQMRPDCFSVSVVEDRVVFIAYEVGDIRQGDIRAPLTLTLDGASEGIYTLDDNGDENDTDDSFAQVGRTDSLEPSFATSGSVTVTTLSASGMSGTFEFITLSGLRVENGRFFVSR